VGGTTNFLALRNRQNLVLGKNNQVSLTIGQIFGTAAENTGWLRGHFIETKKSAREQFSAQLGRKVLCWAKKGAREHHTAEHPLPSTRYFLATPHRGVICSSLPRPLQVDALLPPLSSAAAAVVAGPPMQHGRGGRPGYYRSLAAASFG